MLRGAVNEGFVDHQPAIAGRQPVMPVKQLRPLEAGSARVVGMHQQQHIGIVDAGLDIGCAIGNRRQNALVPRVRMFGIGGGQQGDPCPSDQLG
ncbi:hypothetical protein SDC9_196433 [bioreactor metagenome]|uniref:Uncharacterized protein n=1 Tax=bioreactor metagenome TaxID=1076179 RepID=A0A645IBU6_9ZZZZ